MNDLDLLESAENLAPRFWSDQKLACPKCSSTRRIEYSVFTDKQTCHECGCVGTVNEFRFKYYEMFPPVLEHGYVEVPQVDAGTENSAVLASDGNSQLADGASPDEAESAVVKPSNELNPADPAVPERI